MAAGGPMSIGYGAPAPMKEGTTTSQGIDRNNPLTKRPLQKVKKGYIQVYTGDGKGKTTAALGLSLRASGAGLNVFIAQFIKSGTYSELESLKRYADRITLEQFGLGRVSKKPPPPEYIEAAKKGIQKVKQVLTEGAYDVVILEEASVATAKGFFSVEDLLDIIAMKPNHVELIITGRHADPRIIERADLVTEMKKIKHYFEKGVRARVGIEK
jgi:cob(I)alamin adenosyltransferase